MINIKYQVKETNHISKLNEYTGVGDVNKGEGVEGEKDDVDGIGEENDKDKGENDEDGDGEENIGNCLEEEKGDGVDLFLILIEEERGDGVELFLIQFVFTHLGQLMFS